MGGAKVKQYEAEQQSSRLNLRNALSNLQLASRQRADLLKRLGVKDEPGYLLPDGTRIFILTDPEKRIDHLPDPLPGKAEKKDDSKPTSQENPN